MEPVARRRWRVPLPLAQFVIAVMAGLFLLLAGWLAVVRDPQGGEPFAVAVIERTIPVARTVPPAQDAAAPAADPAHPPAADGRSTAGDLEEASGVKVVRQGGGDAPGALVIHVPSPGALVPAPDKRLVERSRHGILPRIGADGARPAEVYARPAAPPPAKLAGRIAILVGGLGLSQSSTADAIAKLPPPVTLAFAPYGTDLERQAARAREEGHEIMIQVPMEPFDYPDNDPGPHTLTLSSQPAETLDRLAWVMSRLVGYVGLSNYMGGKFTSSESALAPVLKEVGGRGLVYLDDGTSPRSLAPSLATALKVPAGRADLTVDTVPKASAIDDQLARLETIAREKGLAVGNASALPVTIERLSQWAKGLEARGFQLVPVTAAIAQPGKM
jgi:uncharacterized protein